MGQGFRLGFNGSLHMDVFRQRLEDEYGEEVIVTRPLVPVKRESSFPLIRSSFIDDLKVMIHSSIQGWQGQDYRQSRRLP